MAFSFRYSVPPESWTGIATARTTQIMPLLNLAPDIQEQILFLPRTEYGRDENMEKAVRPIAQSFDRNKQRRLDLTKDLTFLRIPL